MSAETYARLQEALIEHLSDEDAGAVPVSWVLVAETARMGDSLDEDETAMRFIYHGSYFSTLGLLVQAQRVINASGEIER